MTCDFDFWVVGELWQWHWVMYMISKDCQWPEKISLDWCYVNLSPCVSNVNEYNTQYTSHKSQVIRHKSYITSHKSQVVSHKSKFPCRASIVLRCDLCAFMRIQTQRVKLANLPRRASRLYGFAHATGVHTHIHERMSSSFNYSWTRT